jgi:hypothetical protein
MLRRREKDAIAPSIRVLRVDARKILGCLASESLVERAFSEEGLSLVLGYMVDNVERHLE